MKSKQIAFESQRTRNETTQRMWFQESQKLKRRNAENIQNKQRVRGVFNDSKLPGFIAFLQKGFETELLQVTL